MWHIYHHHRKYRFLGLVFIFWGKIQWVSYELWGCSIKSNKNVLNDKQHYSKQNDFLCWREKRYNLYLIAKVDFKNEAMAF